MNHLLLVALGLAACTTDRHPDEPRATVQPVPEINPARPSASARPNAVVDASPRPAAELDRRFIAKIRAASAPYQSWGRVEARPNIAPMLCDMPRAADWGSKGQVHMSDAEDAPHGKKLYYLWASQRDAYLALATQPAAMPVGFTIVKQSFEARATAPAAPPVHGVGEPALEDTIQVGQQWMTTGAAKGLYVMTKVGAGDGTDAGWIYGTIDPRGEVTSAGRVASCIGCHEDAPHDRLFGPKHP